MILNVLSFLFGIVASIVAKMNDLMITTGVSLLSVLIIWQLIIIILGLLSKLGKGSGNPKGADDVKIRVDPNTGVVVKGTQKDFQNAQAKYYKDMLG